MFNIGTGEMVLICVIALLILGPSRLPETARSIGRFLRNFKHQTNAMRNLVEREFLRMDLDENNQSALDSMATEKPKENPPLSAAPEFPTPAPAAVPHALPSMPQDLSSLEPYDFSETEACAPSETETCAPPEGAPEEKASRGLDSKALLENEGKEH